MSLPRRRFITITAGCLLTARTAGAANMGARWQGVALGAHADLRLVGLPAQEAESLIVLARAEIERLEQLFSLYRDDSALVRLNATGMLDGPSADLLELCSHVSSIHAVSDGLFDPTIQPLWSAYARGNGVIDKSALKAARAVVGWDKVEASAGRIRLRPGAALTFNGIAQGFITDKVVALLKSQGLEAGLVSVGEIAAVGTSPSGDGWEVGLAEHEDDAARTSIRLRDQAVATSSPRGTLIGESQSGHILNPRTGEPAASNWSRVSVVHRLAAVADGLSTAAVLMSEEEVRRLAGEISGASFTVATPSGGEFSIYS